MLLLLLKAMTKKAFTLIELIICIVIVSVLVGVIKVNLSHNKKSLALEELNLIYESISNAKSYSITHKKTVTVFSDTASNTFTDKSNKYYFKTIKCKYLKILSTLSLEFNSNGIPSKGNTYKFFCDGKYYDIRITPATANLNIVEVK